MLYRPLGASGLCVSRIGLGTMGFGGRYQRVDGGERDACRLIHRALDLGITLFDTAEVYGEGHGEEILGAALRGRRDRAVIATKFSAANSRPEAVKAACEGSLRRLGVDCIDLYQNHWPDPAVPIAETIGAMADLVWEGKVRAIGLSNCTGHDATAATAALANGPCLASIQQDYSLHERFAERRVLPWARAHGVALIAYSPLGQGRTSGPDPRMVELARIAADVGVTAAQAMLAWLLHDEAVVPIPMTSRETNLIANAAAVDVVLPSGVADEIDALFRSTVRDLRPADIAVEASHHGKVMRTREEALDNVHGLVPSPAELARDMASGDLLKPIKVCPPAEPGGRYRLVEGQLRYWAWVIAHGDDRPIPAQLVSDGGHSRSAA
ncbi:MAG: aldo/keto reductase [Alphaproteobacteria bacterium]